MKKSRYLLRLAPYRSNDSNNVQKKSFSKVFIAFLLAILISIGIYWYRFAYMSSASNSYYLQSDMSHELKPKSVQLNGVRYFWQSFTTNPRAIVFLAHGCKRFPTFWWPRSKDCLSCIGMPAEKNLLNEMLKQNLLVMSAFPIRYSNQSDCWNPDDSIEIGQFFFQLFQNISQKNSSKGIDSSYLAEFHRFRSRIPVHFVGVMNGAILVGELAKNQGKYFKDDNFVSSISIINGGLWNLDASRLRKSNFPATLFVDMSRQSDLCLHNNATVDQLNRHHIDARQVTADPLPITPSFFWDHGKVLLMNESRVVYDALLQNSALWPNNGLLLLDPFVHAQYKKLVDVCRLYLSLK